MVPEARLEQLDAGLTPVTDGWFVVNVRDGAWVTNDALGAAFIVEGDDAPFPDVGFTLLVLQPGQPSMYHREANQEDFLVLAGECLLLIEGEERSLRAWDFVHCPPDTEHAFVGAGDDGLCVIFMTGARKGWPEKGIVYPRSELALRHGAASRRRRRFPQRRTPRSRSGSPGHPPTGAGCPGPRASGSRSGPRRGHRRAAGAPGRGS
jgi:quercetin dioxygenase-like cupin family protein